MRGIPKIIQTPADLHNLHVMAKTGKLTNAEKNEVVERCNALLAEQYHRVPILSVKGTEVKTNYFPECTKGAVTTEGLTVSKIEHIEDIYHDGPGKMFSESIITLSKAPTDKTVLSIIMEDNFLTQNNFKLEEINFIKGALTQ